MFLKPTTILVGAGASAEFGLPTGEAIYREASEENRNVRRERADNEAQFLSSFGEFLAFSNDGPAQVEFWDMVPHLQSSPAYSIDLYAYYNPSRSRVAKYYTVWALIKRHFQINSNRTHIDGSIWRYGQRYYPWHKPYLDDPFRRPNWLGVLTNQFLAGARSPDDLRKNDLTFVTLNYDRVIEETFGEFVRSHEMFADTPDEFLPSVIHVHGKLDEISNESLNFQFYKNQVEKIQFILDSLEETPPAAVVAIERLKESASIYSIGFAFEENNCELLQADGWASRAAALNFSGDIKSNMSMKRIGIPPEKIWRGSPTQPKYLGVAANEGFFRCSSGCVAHHGNR